MAAMLSGAKRPRPTPLSPADFTTILSDLDRPEGIAATPDGRLFLSNAKATIAVLEPSGDLRQIGPALAPTGVAIDRQGRAIVANMGLLNKGPGPLQRVDVTTGTVETLADSLEGRALVASNAPAVARDGTVYCSHSTWGPVANIGTTTPAGFVYKVAPDGQATIVARGLRGANGVCLDRGDRHLYVALTAEGRIRRWRRRADGTLDRPEYYGPPLGTVVPDHMMSDILKLDGTARAALGYCDGIAFDEEGNLWVTLPLANRLVAITPAGKRIDIVHDPEGKAINVPTSLCWGGRDRRDLYVVSRGSGRIVRARTAVAGLPMANWPA